MIYPYQNPDLQIEERVEDLFMRMTRDEKVGQLCQIFRGAYPSEEAFHAVIAAGRAGSRILSDGGFAGNTGAGLSISDLNVCQKIAVEQTRLGIPLLYGRDVIYGQRTIFPIPLAQAASFNPELVEQSYTCIAREAAAVGVHWTFSPMMDIARDPRWGRVIEGSGEDPWLASGMAVAAVQGLQGEDPSDPERILACAKHFVGYGAAEGGRDYDTAELSENTLRNIYLRPFKAAVDAGVATVMSGFHDIGGVPASGNYHTLTDILKEEWGFDGFVVSDWGSVTQLRHFGFAEDDKDSARLAFEAGVDMEMTANAYERHLSELIDERVISTDRLADGVRRVLRAKFRAGIFEQPYVEETLWKKVLLRDEHRAKALQLAEESLVLVKNEDGILPLAKRGLHIGVVGPFANEKRSHLGSWVVDDASDVTTSIVEGLRQVAPDSVIKVSGTELCEGLSELILLQANGEAPMDVAVVCVGEHYSRNGEASSIADLSLPSGQEQLIETAASAGIPIVVVCCAGRPLPMPAAEQYASAILYAWNGGICAGEAIARVLVGDADPGGRLPMSIPKNSGQIPVYYNRKSPGKIGDFTVPYHCYLDEEFAPLHSFGFGMSYTKFELDEIKISNTEISVDGTTEVEVRLRNVGDRIGTTVVQCYVQDVAASTVRPTRELKGFRKICLKPGEETRVTFALGPKELEFFGAKQCWAVEPGLFRVYLGLDCKADLSTEFRVVQ